MDQRVLTAGLGSTPHREGALMRGLACSGIGACRVSRAGAVRKRLGPGVLAAALALLGVIASGVAGAQPSAVVPSAALLSYGTAHVGFRILELRDRSREFFGGDSYAARPLQVVVWYPARGGGAAMRFAEYVAAQAGETDFAPSTARRDAALADFRRAAIANGAADADVGKLLASPVRGRRDARPADGRHPLVLYAHNLTPEKAVLGEYLASHGFVVASTPQLGSYERDLDVGTTLVETEIRDLEAALAALAVDPMVDARKIGIIGMSFGALTALGFQMRHPSVAAVVSLDGGIGTALDPLMLRQSAFHAPDRARVPLLHLYASDSPGADFAYLRGLRYAERSFVGVHGMQHGDFAGYGMLAATVPRIRGNANPQVALASSWAFRYALHFLRSALRGTGESRRFLERGPRENGIPDGLVTVERVRAAPAPPTTEQLRAMIRRDGLAPVLALYDTLRASDPLPFGAETFRLIGTWLMDENRPTDATTLLSRYVRDAPTSARAHYYLAVASARAGRPAGAREHYERALTLVETDPELDTATRDRIRARSRAALDGLRG
jgi:tetratricopeptide (TPR) repeat protein